MASGKVTMVFSAEDAQFVNKTLRVRETLGQLEKKAEDLKGSMKRGGQQADSTFLGMTRGALAGVVTLGALKAAWSSIAAEIDKTAEAGKRANQVLQSAVAGAGDAAALGQVRRDLRHLGGAKHLTMEERVAAYSGVRGALPTADRATVMALTSQAARSTVITGGGAAEAGAFGSVAGELSKIGYGDQDAADLTLFLQQTAGKFGKQVDKGGMKGLQRLVTAGVDKDQALAYMAAAAESSQGMEATGELASWIAQGRKGKAPIGAQAILGAAESKDYLGMVRQARTGDYFEQEMRRALRDRDVQSSMNLRSAEAEVSMAEYDNREAAMHAKANSLRFDAGLRRGGGLHSLAPVRWVAGEFYSAGNWAGVSGDIPGMNAEEMQARYVDQNGGSLQRSLDANTRAMNDSRHPTRSSQLP
jgi:hypothetical protein